MKSSLTLVGKSPAYRPNGLSFACKYTYKKHWGIWFCR